MVDDYGVYEVMCRLHACDGVEVGRTAVDGLEMGMVLLGYGDGVLKLSFVGIHYIEVEGVFIEDITHRQGKTVCIFLLVDENAILAVALGGGDCHVASRELFYIAVQLVCGIDRVVERTVEGAASHHHQEAKQYDWDYLPHLISFSI